MTLSLDLFYLITHYIICTLLYIEVSTFRKKFLIKDDMYGVKNDISLCMPHEVISIILICNKYYQFRVWYKFLSINFSREEHISSTAKDMKVQCFEFVFQEDFLMYSSLKIFDRYTIIYMSHSYYWNSHQKSGRHALSCIDYVFSSKVQFDLLVWLFCWYC